MNGSHSCRKPTTFGSAPDVYRSTSTPGGKIVRARCMHGCILWLPVIQGVERESDSRSASSDQCSGEGPPAGGASRRSACRSVMVLPCMNWVAATVRRSVAGPGGEQSPAVPTTRASDAADSTDEDLAKVRIGPCQHPRRLPPEAPPYRPTNLPGTTVRRAGRVAGARELSREHCSPTCIVWRAIRVRLTAPFGRLSARLAGPPSRYGVPIDNGW